MADIRFFCNSRVLFLYTVCRYQTIDLGGRIQKDAARKRTGDADDVAHLRAKLVTTGGNAVQQALKLHKPLNNLLIRILTSGPRPTSTEPCSIYGSFGHNERSKRERATAT